MDSRFRHVFMPDVLPHPKQSQLTKYLLGSLSDAELERVERHLSICDECAARTLELQPRDSLTELLTAAANSTVAKMLETETIDGTLMLSAASTSVCGKPTGAGDSPQTVAAEEIPAQLLDHPRYKVVRVLGRGGMGTVWLAEHLVLGRLVALKMLRSDWMQNPETVSRFYREIRAAARLHDPHIAAVPSLCMKPVRPFAPLPGD